MQEMVADKMPTHGNAAELVPLSDQRAGFSN